MLDYNKIYQLWLENTKNDLDIYESLKSLNEEEIKDSFYQELEFGTAGLRGKLGPGTNRMNKYIIARATQAFANVIKKYGKEYMDRGVAIAHDCRIMSPEFAELSALIMASNGIKTYLFESLRPTPELSYTVLYYKCAAGINITASHNPKNYNGYKVYWEEGSQIKDDISSQILEEINKLDMFTNYVKLTRNEAIEKGILSIIGKEVDEAYYKEVLGTLMRDDNEIDKSIKLVYTPLNGAGNIPVREVLKRANYKNIYVVSEQEKPDGTFPTLVYPNPEDLKAFEYSEKLAFEKNADILIATDPDCDRLAVEVMHNGKIVPLNGNQTGVLMIDYLIKTLNEKGKMPKNPVIVKSIVTGEMGTQIAKENNVEMINVLTGFKNICAISNMYEKTNEKKYIFGYEESIGYNVGTFVRDKDGVTSAVFLTEMAAYYKKQGKTLIDVIEDLYKKYGYYKDEGVSIVLEGIEGQQRIKRMMVEIRKIYPKLIGNAKLVEITDYMNQTKLELLNNNESKIDIEKTNAIEFRYDDESWYTLRPSGTEPKIKIYLYVKDIDNEKALNKLKLFKETIVSLVNSIE